MCEDLRVEAAGRRPREDLSLVHRCPLSRSRTSYAQLRLSGGPTVDLRPGDLVGRLRSAALRIDDPRISEVHAYLSVRDGALKLLSLRGGLAVDGRMVREVTLADGLRITLAHQLELEVVAVHNPSALLALDGGGIAREVLSGAALSVVDQPGVATVQLVGRIVPGAAVHLWTDGEGWVHQLRGGVPAPLEAGARLVLDAATIEVIEVPGLAGDAVGTGLAGRIDPPLRIEGYFDAVQLHAAGRPTAVLGGAAARLLCELGAIGQPVHWAEVARAVWPEEREADHELLRKRWDVMLIRLRRRLGRAGIRPDLIRSDGTGNVQLVLRADDVFVDLA
ncbi:MAG: FHA domain-containing protein [Myxococcota bacterium]